VAVVGYGLWVSGERVSKRRSDFFLVFRWAEAKKGGEEAGKRQEGGCFRGSGGVQAVLRRQENSGEWIRSEEEERGERPR
jgi:hypothetical protein